MTSCFIGSYKEVTSYGDYNSSRALEHLSGNKGQCTRSLNYIFLLVTLHSKGSDYEFVRNIRNVKVRDKGVLLN